MKARSFVLNSKHMLSLLIILSAINVASGIVSFKKWGFSGNTLVEATSVSIPLPLISSEGSPAGKLYFEMWFTCNVQTGTSVKLKRTKTSTTPQEITVILDTLNPTGTGTLFSYGTSDKKMLFHDGAAALSGTFPFNS